MSDYHAYFCNDKKSQKPSSSMGGLKKFNQTFKKKTTHKNLLSRLNQKSIIKSKENNLISTNYNENTHKVACHFSRPIFMPHKLLSHYTEREIDCKPSQSNTHKQHNKKMFICPLPRPKPLNYEFEWCTWIHNLIDTFYKHP